LPPPKGVGAFVDSGGYPDGSLGFTFVSVFSFVVASTFAAPSVTPEPELNAVTGDTALVSLLATADEPGEKRPAGTAPPPNVNPSAPIDASPEDANGSDAGAAGAGAAPPSDNPPAPIDASPDATDGSDVGAVGAVAPPKVNPPAPIDASPEVADGSSDAGATGAAPPNENPPAPIDAPEGIDGSDAGAAGATWPSFGVSHATQIVALASFLTMQESHFHVS
jgi:hypothetical protein